jgi:hypothetical protein
MELKPMADVANTVLLGSFNPAIFQPAWFASKELISEAEAKAATVEVIHPEVAQFKTDWLQLAVTRNRFTAMTSDPSCRIALRDFVVGTFALLEHTPTTHMGLNRAMHVDMVDEARWHRLGHRLAPKEPWNGLVAKPGLRTLLMECQRSDDIPGRQYVRVEPSQMHPHAAFIEVTKEFHVVPGQEASATQYFVRHLSADWADAMEEAYNLASSLLLPVLKGAVA